MWISDEQLIILRASISHVILGIYFYEKNYLLFIQNSNWIEQPVFFFLIFWLCHMACGILVPPPGIKPAPPALETRSLNHWTAREVLNSLYLNGRPCGEGLPEGWASACLIPENLFKSAAIFEYILLRAESCSSPDAGLWSTAGMKRQAGLTLH